jgi:hypothetical protein
MGITKEAYRGGIISQESSKALLEFCIDHECDVKREDALMVLEKIKMISRG